MAEYYDKLIEEYNGSLQEREKKVNQMPPSDEKAQVRKICDFVRSEIIKLEEGYQKSGFIPYSGMERLDSFFDTIERLLPKTS